MITVASIVEDKLKEMPFIQEAMAEDLINLSALARKLQPLVEESLGKPVQLSSIIMALKRMVPRLRQKLTRALHQSIRNLGEIMIRSDLVVYTFINSPTIIQCNKMLIESSISNPNSFYTTSRGLYETTFVVSSSLVDSVESFLAGERLIHKRVNLSAITIKLPKMNVDQPGLYYYIFKTLAWAGINITDVVSTSYEFSIFVDNKDVGKAFEILTSLKKI